MVTFGADPQNWTDEELSWLKPFANTKVLGFGEAIHTSDGFYRAKVRIIKYLVQHHGYRAISFENPWGEALAATNFVERGEGTVKDALKGFLRVWRSTSVEELLLWLREWNQKNPGDKVRLFGNDTQQFQWDLDCLLKSSLIAEADKIKLRELMVKTFGEEVTRTRYGASETFKNLRKTDFADGQDRSSDIVKLLQSKKIPPNSLEENAQESLIAGVLFLAKQITGDAKDIAQLRGESFAHRDRCMSHFTVKFAGTDKTILWAHNWHIVRASEALAEGLFHQGQFLRKELGEGYKAIAISATHIKSNWPWLPPEFSGEAINQENSLEVELAAKHPQKSVFVESGKGFSAKNYAAGMAELKEGEDISAQFDGLLVLPESGPIEYAVDWNE
ncbi:MAG: erythromycin esterase family protein [Bdellovibrio sp.]|nr:erythromycin esterase family protein [Bdellovibrio sp.]